MPFIQITIAEGHDAATKRALVTRVSAAAAAAETWVTSDRLVAASCPSAMVICMNGMGAAPFRDGGQVTDLVNPPSTSMTCPVI